MYQSGTGTKRTGPTYSATASTTSCYLIERSQSLATGGIRPYRDNRQSKKGWRKEPRKVMSLRAAQRMRPKRNEIIFCTGVAVAAGLFLCPRPVGGRWRADGVILPH